jgi:hypothetical protein
LHELKGQKEAKAKASKQSIFDSTDYMVVKCAELGFRCLTGIPTSSSDAKIPGASSASKGGWYSESQTDQMSHFFVCFGISAIGTIPWWLLHQRWTLWIHWLWEQSQGFKEFKDIRTRDSIGRNPCRLRGVCARVFYVLLWH